jgi:hypothetical protein
MTVILKRSRDSRGGGAVGGDRNTGKTATGRWREDWNDAATSQERPRAI